MGALRFGISRGNGGPNLLVGAQRFAEVCGAVLKLAISVSVAYDYERLLRDLLDEAIDFAWMPPLAHAQAAGQGAQLAAVSQRGGRLFYRSAILARAELGWSTVHDVRRARVAWVDPASASGHIFPRLFLVASGIPASRLFRSERFLGAATNACRAVSQGEADLCACFVSSADTVHDAQREIDRTFGTAAAGLKVFALTEPIPPDGIIFRKGIASADVKAHQKELLGLHQVAAGKEALAALFQAERLAPVNKPVLDALARLRAEVERASPGG